MTPEMARQHRDTALTMAAQADVANAEKAAMLADVGSGLLQRPQSREQIGYAIELLEKAGSLLAEGSLELARIQILLAGALQQLPPSPDSEGAEELLRVRDLLQTALSQLEAQSDALQPGELAEAQLALGLILQHLASCGQARMQDAIAAYQCALRDFNARSHPAEYAIVQNNLASAWLAMTAGDSSDRMREAMAVQAFEAALEVVSIERHPNEYAMLQNNLGNALQYAASGHALANNLRAMQAYDEALRVRNQRDTPLPYANTLANRANCLRNLPDDPEQPEQGNRANLARALEDYTRAGELFRKYGDVGKLAHVEEAMAEIRLILNEGPLQAGAIG